MRAIDICLGCPAIKGCYDDIIFYRGDDPPEVQAGLLPDEIPAERQRVRSRSVS